MFRFTKWIAAPIVAIGLMYAADAPSAEAQYGCYGPGGGGGGLSISVGGGRYGGYRANYRSHYPSSFGYGSGRYGGYGNGVGYRGVGHYDYHPTEIYRHGNHFHAQPGHYDYHVGGHYGHGRH